MVTVGSRCLNPLWNRGFRAGWLSVVAASVRFMEPALAISDLDALDASATLAAVEDELVARRRAEARDLALAAHWADLHAADPQLGPVGVGSGRGRTG